MTEQDTGDGRATAEPIVLVAKGDPNNNPLLYACARCGAIHSPNIYLASKEVKHETAYKAAQDCYTCKTHYNCDTCGCETPKGWTRCESCRFDRVFNAAEEIADNGGPYCAFDGDIYYHDLEEAHDDGCEWVSPCHIEYPRLDSDSILEGLLEDMHEEASTDDLEGVDEFVAAVKAFNDAQRCQSWWGDNKRKINVAQAIEASGRDGNRLDAQHESAVRKDVPKGNQS